MPVNVLKKLSHAASIEGRTARIILRNGLPDAILQFGGGIGDELLLTTVAHELRRRDPSLKIWQVSHSAELLRHNQDYAEIFTWDDRCLRNAFLLQGRRRNLAYAVERIPRKEEISPSEHILAVLCRKAGISGSVALRPYLSLTDEEINSGILGDFQITVQCLGPESFQTVMLNKLWNTEKFQ